MLKLLEFDNYWINYILYDICIVVLEYITGVWLTNIVMVEYNMLGIIGLTCVSLILYFLKNAPQ